MAHYDQNQKEVTKRGTSAQRRPLRGLRSIPFGNPGPSDRNHRNRHWAALAGTRVIAVEAQQGFAPEIRRLAAHNGVGPRVNVEIALAGGTVAAGAAVGVVADDQCWAATSHGAPQRPAGVSVPQLMSAYQIGRIGLLKVDIEGGEFAVFGSDEDLRWLDQVDQVVMEVHPSFGDAAALIGRLRQYGFAIDLRDNAGTRVSATSDRLEYAYCRR